MILAIDYTQVIVAAFVAVPATIGAIAAWRAARHAKAVNDSVNHRHEDEPRMLDYVRRIDSQVALAAAVATESQRLLLEHIQWQDQQGYLTPEQIKDLILKEIESARQIEESVRP